MYCKIKQPKYFLRLYRGINVFVEIISKGTAAIPHSQNRWIQAVEQRVESLIIVWEKVSYRMKLRAKCRAFLAQQNETFEGCSI